MLLEDWQPEYWNGSLPQSNKLDTIPFNKTVTGVRYNVQTINNDGDIIGIPHVCSIFQGKLPLFSLLGYKRHPIRHISLIIAHLKCRILPDTIFHFSSVQRHEVEAIHVCRHCPANSKFERMWALNYSNVN